MPSSRLVGVNPRQCPTLHGPVCAALAAQADCGLSPVLVAGATALGPGWCVVQAVAGCEVTVGLCLAACLPWGLCRVVDSVCASSVDFEPWPPFHAHAFSFHTCFLFDVLLMLLLLCPMMRRWLPCSSLRAVHFTPQVAAARVIDCTLRTYSTSSAGGLTLVQLPTRPAANSPCCGYKYLSMPQARHPERTACVWADR